MIANIILFLFVLNFICAIFLSKLMKEYEEKNNIPDKNEYNVSSYSISFLKFIIAIVIPGLFIYFIIRILLNKTYLQETFYKNTKGENEDEICRNDT